MQTKVASWNLCLGLFHKKDYVKATLHKYNIDILNLQEAEIKEGLNEKILNIPGYSLETEKSFSMKRVATYVNNNVKYRRRKDLEEEGCHMLVLDIGTKQQTRIINVYRPFNPKTCSEREFFNKQLTSIDNILTNKTILLGDFNESLFLGL